MPGEPRFLQYRTPRPRVAGLLDLSGRLALLLREAHVTGRLAILPPLTLDPRHNFGVRREWRWEHYFDLDASRLIDADGRQHPLPIADCRPGSRVRTLKLRGGTRMPDRAQDYPLVVRRLSHLSSLRRQLPVAGWPAATVDLRPAARAAALALPVVERLRSLGGGRFVTVHVRRGDRIALGQVPDRLTRPAHVGRCLRDRGVADGAVVYVATDERDPDFWRPLQETWRLFRHVDFPALDALISGVEEAPDNYLLFQVEREILREGHLRLGTMPNRDWAYMHGWFIDPKNWPPSKMRSPSARRRWLVNRVRWLGMPVLRVEEMLPQNLSRALGSIRRRTAAVLRRFEGDRIASGRHHGSGLPGISFRRRLSRLAWLAANRRRSLSWLLRCWRRTALAGWTGARRRGGRGGTSPGSGPFRTTLVRISHQGTKRAPSFGAPSFDLRIHNPIHWPRAVGAEVAALGPLDLLPSGVRADRVARCRDPLRLRRFHHLEDVQAFHADVAARAGALVRLAASGAVVHVADADQRLEELLGLDLYRLMTTDVSAFDAGARELHSIGMRRAAMRGHSSWARDPGKLPTVSVLLATRRPALLPRALAAVASQTWPRLELVLALHGNEASFAGVEVEQHVAALPVPARIVRVSGSVPLGAVLNTAVAAAGGTLLAKMDDDDRYGADHLWDLVLAHEYSRARLVGKGMEFVYLAAADRTVHCHAGRGETWRASCLAGGTLLISRDDLDRTGGWRNEPRGVDQALIDDVLRAGAGVYRTHGAGFMLVRHGRRHTWETGEDRFLAKADRIIPGWAPGVAGLPDLPRPPDVGDRRSSCAGDRRPTAAARPSDPPPPGAGTTRPAT